MGATKMALVALLVVASAGVAADQKREMALANVTRFSTGDLFSLVGSDCGPTRCMEVSQGTALAAMGGSAGACICKCRRENPAFREDQRICVEHIDECPMAVFGRGTKKPNIPFVFLPLKGQIIYPSKEIVFTDEEDSICAVTSAQYLSTSGWVTLRDLLDNDVPFSLYRDEGSTFLQWRGSAALHARLEGKLVAAHVLCSAQSPARLAASCAAFRVAGSSHNALFDVRSIPFHAGEIVSTDPNQKEGLTVLECLAIGVCVLMLIFVYAAGIIFYINYKQRQRRKNKDPEISNTASTEGSIASRIDMDNVMLKTNPLLKMEGLADFGDFGMSGLSDVSEHTEDTLDSSSKNTQKKQTGNVISAMVHSRNKKQIRPLSRSASSTPERDRISERLQRRSLSPDIERAPHSELAIVDCLENNMFERHLSYSNVEPVIRRKLYFNPVFFETEHLKNPPPAAIEFLVKIREVMSIAKDRMTTKKFIPYLSDIPEEESYHSVDLGWDIPCARRGRRFSAISLKRENSRRGHCGGCPGCDREPVPKAVLTRSNSCKSCVSEDYKQKIVRKWLDEVPAPAPRSIITNTKSGPEEIVQQSSSVNPIPRERVSSPKPDAKEETKSPKGKAPPVPTKDGQNQKENIKKYKPNDCQTDKEPKIIDIVKKKELKEVDSPPQKELIKVKENIKRKDFIKQDELFKQNISKYLDNVVFNNIQREKDIVKEKMGMLHDFDELNNDMFKPKSPEFSGVFITKEILKERDIHIKDLKKDIKRLREEKDSVKQYAMKRNESSRFNNENSLDRKDNVISKETLQNDNHKKSNFNKYLEGIKKDLNKVKYDIMVKDVKSESTSKENIKRHAYNETHVLNESQKRRSLSNETTIENSNEKIADNDIPYLTVNDKEETKAKEVNQDKNTKLEVAKQSKFKDFIKQIDEVLKSKDSGNKNEESHKAPPVKLKPIITKDMISPPNSAIAPVLVDDLEKSSPTNSAMRRVRKKLPPPPPPPVAKPRDVINPVTKPAKEDEAPIPPEVKIKMEAVIKEFNYCRRAEPEALEDIKIETIEPIPPKIIIPVVAADTYYFSDDNLVIEPQRKHSFVQHEPFVDLDSSERAMLKTRRFSLACGPELALRENIVYPNDIQTARDTLRRGWREVRQAVESHHYMAPHHNSIPEKITCPNEIFIENNEPYYDVIATPGPLTIEVRGSPVEKRRNNCDEFDPDTLDRKLMRDNKKRVEKILLKSGGSFKHKNGHENVNIITESPPEFTRKIGSLRQMYEEKSKLMDEQNMRISHYERRGSVPYGNDLASMVKSVYTSDMIRQLGVRDKMKPPVPPKQRRSVVELSPKFSSNVRELQSNEKHRGPEERERYSQYLKAENVIARRSGRRSNRTRSRRTDLRKLYRTEDSGYLSTDSNDSKRRANYLMQLRSRTAMFDQSAMAPSPTIIRTPVLQHIESDTDDLESVCDGRSESGGESIETDSVFFGNFDDTKQMLAELGMHSYDVHRKLNSIHDQIDSGFMGETNIILSGDSDSEHRSVISITTGRDGRPSSTAIIEERPYMPIEL